MTVTFIEAENEFKYEKITLFSTIGGRQETLTKGNVGINDESGLLIYQPDEDTLDRTLYPLIALRKIDLEEGELQ